MDYDSSIIISGTAVDPKNIIYIFCYVGDVPFIRFELFLLDRILFRREK